MELVPQTLKNPTIFLGELRIDEPVTSFTDLVVASICFYAFFKLRKTGHTGTFYQQLLYFFLLLGISTALGGLMGHAFNYALNTYWKLPYWIISMVGIALLERSAISYCQDIISARLIKVFKWINWIELLAFTAIAIGTQEFIYVIGHSTYGLLVVVTSFHLYAYLKTKSKGSQLFLKGAVLCGLGAAVFLLKLSISPWFNHIDLSHVFMAASGYYYYKGSLIQLSERSNNGK